MKCLACDNQDSFTRTELMVLIVVCAVGMALLAVPKRKASRISCANNLRMDGIAIAEYAADHNRLLPHCVSTNTGGSLEYVSLQEGCYLHFRALTHYLPTPLSVICPQDTRRAAPDWCEVSNCNISYFYGLDSAVELPRSMLMGDRNISAQSRTILTLRSCATASWVKGFGLHGEQGHVLFADGSVEMLTSRGLGDVVRRTGTETNRLAIP
ncbi:MAG: hypothetical protein GX456_12895 [Verrucomicrobia bacterium]|nr:hypothetical protein [Verrucomicrobiota bacterium]